jgi:hypothetical protein
VNSQKMENEDFWLLGEAIILKRENDFTLNHKLRGSLLVHSRIKLQVDEFLLMNGLQSI